MKGERIVTTLLAVGVASLVAREFEPTFHRQRNRQELLAVGQRLQIGMSQADAQRIFEERASPRLKLLDAPPGGFVLQTPYEFGAGNWLLLVEVEKGQVAGLRVRTSDSALVHPAGAPPDRALGPTERQSSCTTTHLTAPLGAAMAKSKAAAPRARYRSHRRRR